MKKDYNYNYENRKSSKASVSYSNLGQANCTSSVLKKSPVSNGTLWHTTDTNEFFYDWNGKRTKLNLTGDSASLTAEIDKIKKDLAKLESTIDTTAINQAVNKANQAVTRAQQATTAANNAAELAQQASADAQAAAAQVNDKVSETQLNDAIDEVKGMINNISLTPGPQGEQGLPGKDGVDGKDGQDGAQGPQGEPGRDGVDGKDGKDGQDGAQGPQGEPGRDGKDGVDGKDGQDGAQGPQGEPGRDGVDGKDGADGKDGKDGVDGQDGKSAYELAVEGGFQGTQAEWLESLKGEGLSQADRDLIDSLADFGASDISAGTFPSGNDVEDATAVEGGFATVQDVMDYVNALIEKKKDELVPSGDKNYFYVNASEYVDGVTPTSIYQMNCFEINDDDALTNEGFIFEVKADKEILGYDGGPDDPATTYSQVLTIDVPTGYSVELHSWDTFTNEGYFNTAEELMSNPKGATKKYAGRTYNSYVRQTNDLYESIVADPLRYKIIIKKTN